MSRQQTGILELLPANAARLGGLQHRCNTLEKKVKKTIKIVHRHQNNVTFCCFCIPPRSVLPALKSYHVAHV